MAISWEAIKQSGITSKKLPNSHWLNIVEITKIRANQRIVKYWSALWPQMEQITKFQFRGIHHLSVSTNFKPQSAKPA